MKKNNINYYINSEQYPLEKIYYLCDLADKIRILCKNKKTSDYLSSLLSDKRAILYFNQPSTRTFLSFQNACYILGIKCSEIRDTSTSSFAKGESELDSIKTFSQYVHLIIMRHKDSEFIKTICNKLSNEIRIINAGSGTDQHPTQALLDFYTIYKYGFENKKIGFIGDLKRGRTVRSLSLLLNMVGRLKLYYIAPKEFQIKEDITNKLSLDFETTEDFEKVIDQLDIIYMTRIQHEYGGISATFDRNKYCINVETLKKIKKDSIILHPLPRVDEIDQEVDSDNRAKYWEQAENGMWIRASLIATLFNVDNKIIEKYGNVKMNPKKDIKITT